MRHTFEIGTYRIELSYHAQTLTWKGHPWTHVRLHRESRRSPWSRHLVWGRFSVHIDTPDLDTVSVCPHCGAEAEQRGCGTDACESWTFCSADCGCLEGDGTEEVTVREYEERNA